MDQCSRGQELAGGVLRYPPKPEKNTFFAIRDGYVYTFRTPDRSPPHATGHCVLLLLLKLTWRVPTRENAETNSPVVVIWCREETGWVRCTVRRRDCLSLVSGGGETFRVNSSWYMVLHTIIMTDCCCYSWGLLLCRCCCSLRVRIHREVPAACASLGTRTRASRLL